MLLSPSSGVFFSFSLEAIVPSLSTSFCDFSVFFVVFGYYKTLFSRFQDQLEGFFSVFRGIAVRLHFHVLHRKHQSWLGFVLFCFSEFAPHHWLVGNRRQFFSSLVVVYPPLVIVVFLLGSICFRQ